MSKQFRALWHHLRHEHTDPARMGWAVGVGVFIGVLPLYGLHLAICIGVAWLLKLNKATMYLAANISNPLFAPALIAACIATGEWMRFGVVRPLDTAAAEGFIASLSLIRGELPDFFLSCMLGSLALGTLLGAILGPVAYGVARRWQRQSSETNRPAME